MADRNENLWTNLGKQFTDDLKIVVEQILLNSIGKKTGIGESIEFIPQRDSLFMYVNHYYKAISDGRKPRARKIPINVLLTWLKKYGIQPRNGITINQLAFIIQNSIYKQGIRGKNFLDLVKDSVTDIVEIRVADNLELQIADSLLTTFKIK